MKSIKRASVLLSGILAALATVTAYSSPDGGVTVPNSTSDRGTVPIVDPSVTPVVPTEDPDVAATLGSYVEYCPPGYSLIGNRLCLSSSYFGPVQYKDAQYNCMNGLYGGRLANANDYYYAWKKGFPRMIPAYMWLGPRTGDNRALFNNVSGNYNDPDGETSVFDSRYYRCALGPNWY